MPILPIAIFPTSNSTSMTPSDPDYFLLGQAPYGQTIQEWQGVVGYQQKVLFSDYLTIMVHIPTQYNNGSSVVASGEPTLYITDKYKNVLATVNAAPYYKGKQTIAGNTFVDSLIFITVPLKTYCWSFRFSDFSISTNDTYYLKMTNVGDPGAASTTTRTYYSEPLQLSTLWRNTRRIDFSYNTNIANKGIINSGWYNDFPTNTITYPLSFSVRVELYMNQYTPKVINVAYLQQSYDPLQIKTQQKWTWSLKAGEISQGIPYWMLALLTEALLADNVAITTYCDSQNAFGVRLFTPQSQTSLSDLWKIRDSDNSPLIYASTAVTLISDAQKALVPVGYDRSHEYAPDEYSPDEYA